MKVNPIKELNEIIQDIRKQLNRTNKKFAEQIIKNKDISTDYVKIANSFAAIVQFVKEKNSIHKQPLLEVYELSAALGLLQCQINAFKVSPLTEDAVNKNDIQLAKFKKEILALLERITELKQKRNLKADSTKSENHSITDEYNKLKNQIVDYNNVWETHELNLKAAYYYNYADYLLREPGPAVLIKRALPFFKQSSDFYAQNGREIESKQTDDKIAASLKKLPLRQFQISLPKLTPTEIQSMSRSLTSFIETRVKPPIPKAIISPENLTPREEIHMPKNLTGTVEETLASNFFANHAKRAALDTKKKNISSKKRKISLTHQDTQTVSRSNVVDEHLFPIEEEVFAAIPASLDKEFYIDFTTFYQYLFHYMSSNIQSKRGPKSTQDQFTCLRLAELVLYFIKVSENFLNPDQTSTLQTQMDAINITYREIAQLDNPLYSWARLPFESFKKIIPCASKLKFLFLVEIKDYYLGQNFIDNDSRKIFLNEMQSIIKKSIQSAAHAISTAITKDAIHIITRHLNTLSSELEHRCLTGVLQALEKFYRSPDQYQHHLLELNGIPIKPTNPHYPDFLDKLSNLINLFSAPERRVEKCSAVIFFAPKETILTKKVFLTLLQKHLLMLKADYIPSNKHYSNICQYLTQFITNQVYAQLVTAEQNNAPALTAT